MASTHAIAQGGSGQAFANPGESAYAFSSGLPDKAYATTLIDGASNVASALLGPRDAVFGTAMLGANYAPNEIDVIAYTPTLTYSATSTFDFAYGGDLLLGLIEDQQSGFANGLGFQSMEFTIAANGDEIFDITFLSLAAAESFFHDNVIDLGSDLGPNIDLTFGYTLVADGSYNSGGFGFDFAIGGAVPEPSTWAMMLIGFAGLGFAGYRRARAGHATLAAWPASRRHQGLARSVASVSSRSARAANVSIALSVVARSTASVASAAASLGPPGGQPMLAIIACEAHALRAPL